MSGFSKPISPLYLGVDWNYDHHGIAAVNRMIIEDVNDLCQEIRMYYALLQEERSIQAVDRKDAEKFNVSLVGAEQPIGKKSPLDFDAMNIYAGSFYQHLDSQCKDVTHIIGHVPRLSYAPVNFKKTLFRKSEGDEPKIVLVIHDLPKDSDGNIVEDDAEELFSSANLLLSLGKQMYLAVEKILRTMNGKPTHMCYMPSPPVELLQIPIPESVNNHVQGLQNILLNGSDFININFDLAVKSTIKASDVIFQNATQKDHVSVALQVIKDPMCTKDLKTRFEHIKKEADARYKKLQFSQETVLNKLKMTKILQRSNLCIFPAINESTVLGLEALMAAYSGTPVLVSDSTGAAGVFDTLNLYSSIVRTFGNLETDAEEWSNQIVNKLKDPKATTEEAREVRKTLLLDSAIPGSHLDVLHNSLVNRLLFINILSY